MAEEGFKQCGSDHCRGHDGREVPRVQKQRNTVVTCGVGGGISKPARMLMGLAMNQYLSSAKVLRELGLLDVSRDAGRLTLAKRR